MWVKYFVGRVKKKENIIHTMLIRQIEYDWRQGKFCQPKIAAHFGLDRQLSPAPA